MGVLFLLIGAVIVVSALSWAIEQLPLNLLQLLLIPAVVFALWVTGIAEWVYGVIF